MKSRVLFLALTLAAIASQVHAQDYPTRIVTLVSPFPPGGPSDTAARLVAAPMSKALGQQVIVDNLTGAGGVIGTDHVAKAAPDGYTLIVSGSGTHAAAEYLKKDLPYRSTDFEQIGLINTSPMVIAARSGVPADTLKDFIAYLKANEKKITEADAGVGSISNLACSVFHALADVHPTVAS
jgi:tripartite-type tricarboxylate transporter receptor subunit TctC